MGGRRSTAAILGVALILSLGDTDTEASPPNLRRLARLLLEHPDPVERRRIVKRIARRSSARAATLLDEVSRADPDLGVRRVAIRALARIVADNATDVLVARLLAGGSESERTEIARALALREDGPEALKRLTVERREDRLGQGLAIGAYAALPTRESLPHLVGLARSDDPFVRSEALRALARRPDCREESIMIATDLLRKHADSASKMVALGVLYSKGTPDELPLVRKYTASSRPEIRRLAEATEVRIEWEAYEARRREAAAEGYGVSGAPPRRPKPRSRHDLVFGIDSTGSMAADLNMIRGDIARRAENRVMLGGDIRVGIVFYRDTGRSAGRWEVAITPLTHDLHAVKAALKRIRGTGANDVTASVYRCVDEALNRMGWRWGATRRVTLIADTASDHLKATCRIAAFHRMVDGTRLDVWYAHHTRSKVPKDMYRIAQAGGGTVTLYPERDDR